MGARYYDPALGRFISEDPARNGLNWYAYCNNNPVNLVDETGKASVFVVAVACVVTSAIGYLMGYYIGYQNAIEDIRSWPGMSDYNSLPNWQFLAGQTLVTGFVGSIYGAGKIPPNGITLPVLVADYIMPLGAAMFAIGAAFGAVQAYMDCEAANNYYVNRGL